MSNLIKTGGGIIIGIILTAIVGWNVMPSMMINESASPYGVDETVERIKSNAIAKGWVIPSVQPLHKSIKKHGGGDIPPVMLVNLCQANHAFNILKNDKDRKISVFMPCTMSVYEKSDGKTYIGTMNVGLLGKMFGGNVAEVMVEVATDQQSFISFTK